MIRVLLAEDQTLVRRGIVTLSAMTPDIRVVGETADGAEALLAAETNPHEVAILDIRMPKLTGIEVLLHWKALGKTTPTILHTTFDEDPLFLEAVQTGAHGFLLKDVSLERLAETIAPRMLAAGCDPSRYGVIEGVTDERGESLSFDPAQDVPLLRQTAESIGGVSLLVIDPLISAVAGDAHRANDVRRYLQPIVDLAGELNCAVIGIHHQAKNSAGRDAVSRLLGSQAFTALARRIMQTVRVKETDNRVITISKSNITLDRGGFAYTIEPVQLSNGVSATMVKWGAAVEGTAQSIIDDAEGIERESRPLNRVSEAELFLHEELKGGPRPVRELIELAKNQVNISERTLQRAKERLGIVATKTGFDNGWVWQYPFNPKNFLTAKRATDL